MKVQEHGALSTSTSPRAQARGGDQQASRPPGPGLSEQAVASSGGGTGAVEEGGAWTTASQEHSAPAT